MQASTDVRAHVAAGPPALAGLIVLAAFGTIAAALFTEHVLGYPPCKLCLIQRWPYYAAIPLAALAWIAWRARPAAARALFALLALTFAASAALGVHHAGVEWGWWQGPSDCAGAVNLGPARAEDLLAALNRTRVISCADAPFRLLGLSLAGWNALISLGLAGLAAYGCRAAR